jgi:hypothetical protein
MEYKLNIWHNVEECWIGQHEPIRTNYELNIGDILSLSGHEYYDGIIKELKCSDVKIVSRDYDLLYDRICLYAKVINSDNKYTEFIKLCKD